MTPGTPVDQARVAGSVDAELEPTIELLGRLIAEESVDGSDAIGRCLDAIDEAVAGLGGRRRRVAFGGMPNLVADWGDAGDDRRLILAGHTDVVPAEGAWATNPFELVRRGDTLIGRGVCDMKGALAAFVGALKVVAGLADLHQAPVSLVVTGDEEVGSPRGMVPLLEGGQVTGRWALCGEPTGLDVFTGNRGVAWVRVKINGRGGHAGLPHASENPVWPAARAVTALEALPLDLRDSRFDPSTPSLTVTSMQVDGAPASNTIPDAVWLTIDRRMLPGETADAAIAQIEAAIDDAVQAPFTWALTVERAVPPYIADEGEPLVGTMQRIVRQAGRPGTLGTDPAADDSSWLGNAGIATVLCGPGAPEQAHTTGEHVDISQIRDAMLIYAQLILAAANSGAAAGSGATGGHG
jgi:acetylornithine deacetylase/succinyl-diaminopimelate desuccinylase-like protein